MAAERAVSTEEFVTRIVIKKRLQWGHVHSRDMTRLDFCLPSLLLVFLSLKLFFFLSRFIHEDFTADRQQKRRAAANRDFVLVPFRGIAAPTCCAFSR